MHRAFPKICIRRLETFLRFFTLVLTPRFLPLEVLCSLSWSCYPRTCYFVNFLFYHFQLRTLFMCIIFFPSALALFKGRLSYLSQCFCRMFTVLINFEFYSTLNAFIVVEISIWLLAIYIAELIVAFSSRWFYSTIIFNMVTPLTITRDLIGNVRANHTFTE